MRRSSTRCDAVSKALVSRPRCGILHAAPQSRDRTKHRCSLQPRLCSAPLREVLRAALRPGQAFKSLRAAIGRERKWPDDIQADAELSGIAFSPVPSALNDRFAFDLGDADGLKQGAPFRRLNRRYVADAQALDQHLDRVRVIF